MGWLAQSGGMRTGPHLVMLEWWCAKWWCGMCAGQRAVVKRKRFMQVAAHSDRQRLDSSVDQSLACAVGQQTAAPVLLIALRTDLGKHERPNK